MIDRVLLVEADPVARDRIGGWLEEAGYDVILCPGPQAPTYRCIASDERRCMLTAIADFVVLDLRLASDDAMEGTPGWQLLAYYLDHGRQIVALVDETDVVRPHADKDVAVIRRPVDRAELLAALQALRTKLTDFFPFERVEVS